MAINADNLPIRTGNFVNSESNVENIVDLLNPSQELALFPDKHNTLNTQPAISGNVVGSDGNVYNIVDLVKNSGGISIDQVIVKSATIPTASEDYAGAVYQYVGTTTETYTHGYIYECVGSESTIARAVFEPHYFVFDGDNLTSFFESLGDTSHEVVSGRFKYLQAGDIWNINGLDENGNTIFSDYQLYTQDLIDAGFVFIVPMEEITDESEVNYELAYFELMDYAWERIDVQPNVISPSGVPEVQTPDGSNPDAIVNVDYVDSVVGTIETALETI